MVLWISRNAVHFAVKWLRNELKLELGSRAFAFIAIFGAGTCLFYGITNGLTFIWQPIRKRVASVVGVVIAIAVIGLTVTQKEGIWRVLGFEPMLTVHSFVVRSPDGTISKVSEYMDGDDTVQVDIERLNDH